MMQIIHKTRREIIYYGNDKEEAKSTWTYTSTRNPELEPRFEYLKDDWYLVTRKQSLEPIGYAGIDIATGKDQTIIATPLRNGDPEL